MTSRTITINGVTYRRYRQPQWLWDFAYAFDDALAKMLHHLTSVLPARYNTTTDQGR